jgi:hypothetical protein
MNLKFATQGLFCLLAEALDDREDLVGGLGPLVGFGVLVVPLETGTL